MDRKKRILTFCLYLVIGINLFAGISFGTKYRAEDLNPYKWLNDSGSKYYVANTLPYISNSFSTNERGIILNISKDYATTFADIAAPKIRIVQELGTANGLQQLNMENNSIYSSILAPFSSATEEEKYKKTYLSLMFAYALEKGNLYYREKGKYGATEAQTVNSVTVEQFQGFLSVSGEFQNYFNTSQNSFIPKDFVYFSTIDFENRYDSDNKQNSLPTDMMGNPSLNGYEAVTMADNSIKIKRSDSFYKKLYFNTPELTEGVIEGIKTVNSSLNFGIDEWSSEDSSQSGPIYKTVKTGKIYYNTAGKKPSEVVTYIQSFDCVKITDAVIAKISADKTKIANIKTEMSNFLKYNPQGNTSNYTTRINAILVSYNISYESDFAKVESAWQNWKNNYINKAPLPSETIVIQKGNVQKQQEAEEISTNITEKLKYEAIKSTSSLPDELVYLNNKSSNRNYFFFKKDGSELNYAINANITGSSIIVAENATGSDIDLIKQERQNASTALRAIPGNSKSCEAMVDSKPLSYSLDSKFQKFTYDEYKTYFLQNDTKFFFSDNLIEKFSFKGYPRKSAADMPVRKLYTNFSYSMYEKGNTGFEKVGKDSNGKDLAVDEWKNSILIANSDYVHFPHSPVNNLGNNWLTFVPWIKIGDSFLTVRPQYVQTGATTEVPYIEIKQVKYVSGHDGHGSPEFSMTEAFPRVSSGIKYYMPKDIRLSQYGSLIYPIADKILENCWVHEADGWLRVSYVEVYNDKTRLRGVGIEPGTKISITQKDIGTKEFSFDDYSTRARDNSRGGNIEYVNYINLYPVRNSNDADYITYLKYKNNITEITQKLKDEILAKINLGEIEFKMPLKTSSFVQIPNGVLDLSRQSAGGYTLNKFALESTGKGVDFSKVAEQDKPFPYFPTGILRFPSSFATYSKEWDSVTVDSELITERNGVKLSKIKGQEWLGDNTDVIAASFDNETLPSGFFTEYLKKNTANDLTEMFYPAVKVGYAPVEALQGGKIPTKFKLINIEGLKDSLKGTTKYSSSTQELKDVVFPDSIKNQEIYVNFYVSKISYNCDLTYLFPVFEINTQIYTVNNSVATPLPQTTEYSAVENGIKAALIREMKTVLKNLIIEQAKTECGESISSNISIQKQPLITSDILNSKNIQYDNDLTVGMRVSNITAEKRIEFALNNTNPYIIAMNNYLKYLSNLTSTGTLSSINESAAYPKLTNSKMRAAINVVVNELKNVKVENADAQKIIEMTSKFKNKKISESDYNDYINTDPESANTVVVYLYNLPHIQEQEEAGDFSSLSDYLSYYRSDNVNGNGYLDGILNVKVENETVTDIKINIDSLIDANALRTMRGTIKITTDKGEYIKPIKIIEKTVPMHIPALDKIEIQSQDHNAKGYFKGLDSSGPYIYDSQKRKTLIINIQSKDCPVNNFPMYSIKKVIGNTWETISGEAGIIDNVKFDMVEISQKEMNSLFLPGDYLVNPENKYYKVNFYNESPSYKDDITYIICCRPRLMVNSTIKFQIVSPEVFTTVLTGVKPFEYITDLSPMVKSDFVNADGTSKSNSDTKTGKTIQIWKDMVGENGTIVLANSDKAQFIKIGPTSTIIPEIENLFISSFAVVGIDKLSGLPKTIVPFTMNNGSSVMPIRKFYQDVNGTKIPYFIVEMNKVKTALSEIAFSSEKNLYPLYIEAQIAGTIKETDGNTNVFTSDLKYNLLISPDETALNSFSKAVSKDEFKAIQNALQVNTPVEEGVQGYPQLIFNVNTVRKAIDNSIIGYSLYTLEDNTKISQLNADNTTTRQVDSTATISIPKNVMKESKFRIAFIARDVVNTAGLYGMDKLNQYATLDRNFNQDKIIIYDSQNKTMLYTGLVGQLISNSSTTGLNNIQKGSMAEIPLFDDEKSGLKGILGAYTADWQGRTLSIEIQPNIKLYKQITGLDGTATQTVTIPRANVEQDFYKYEIYSSLQDIFVKMGELKYDINLNASDNLTADSTAILRNVIDQKINGYSVLDNPQGIEAVMSVEQVLSDNAGAYYDNSTDESVLETISTTLSDGDEKAEVSDYILNYTGISDSQKGNFNYIPKKMFPMQVRYVKASRNGFFADCILQGQTQEIAKDIVLRGLNVKEQNSLTSIYIDGGEFPYEVGATYRVELLDQNNNVVKIMRENNVADEQSRLFDTTSVSKTSDATKGYIEQYSINPYTNVITFITTTAPIKLETGESVKNIGNYKLKLTAKRPDDSVIAEKILPFAVNNVNLTDDSIVNLERKEVETALAKEITDSNLYATSYLAKVINASENTGAVVQNGQAIIQYNVVNTLVEREYSTLDSNVEKEGDLNQSSYTPTDDEVIAVIRKNKNDPFYVPTTAEIETEKKRIIAQQENTPQALPITYDMSAIKNNKFTFTPSKLKDNAGKDLICEENNYGFDMASNVVSIYNTTPSKNDTIISFLKSNSTAKVIQTQGDGYGVEIVSGIGKLAKAGDGNPILNGTIIPVTAYLGIDSNMLKSSSVRTETLRDKYGNTINITRNISISQGGGTNGAPTYSIQNISLSIIISGVKGGVLNSTTSGYGTDYNANIVKFDETEKVFEKLKQQLDDYQKTNPVKIKTKLNSKHFVINGLRLQQPTPNTADQVFYGAVVDNATNKIEVKIPENYNPVQITLNEQQQLNVYPIETEYAYYMALSKGYIDSNGNVNLQALMTEDEYRQYLRWKLFNISAAEEMQQLSNELYAAVGEYNSLMREIAEAREKNLDMSALESKLNKVEKKIKDAQLGFTVLKLAAAIAVPALSGVMTGGLFMGATLSNAMATVTASTTFWTTCGVNAIVSAAELSGTGSTTFSIPGGNYLPISIGLQISEKGGIDGFTANLDIMKDMSGFSGLSDTGFGNMFNSLSSVVEATGLNGASIGLGYNENGFNADLGLKVGNNTSWNIGTEGAGFNVTNQSGISYGLKKQYEGDWNGTLSYKKKSDNYQYTAGLNLVLANKWDFEKSSMFADVRQTNSSESTGNKDYTEKTVNSFALSIQGSGLTNLQAYTAKTYETVNVVGGLSYSFGNNTNSLTAKAGVVYKAGPSLLEESSMQIASPTGRAIGGAALSFTRDFENNTYATGMELFVNSSEYKLDGVTVMKVNRAYNPETGKYETKTNDFSMAEYQNILENVTSATDKFWTLRNIGGKTVTVEFNKGDDGKPQGKEDITLDELLKQEKEMYEFIENNQDFSSLAGLEGKAAMDKMEELIGMQNKYKFLAEKFSSFITNGNLQNVLTFDATKMTNAYNEFSKKVKEKTDNIVKKNNADYQSKVDEVYKKQAEINAKQAGTRTKEDYDQLAKLQNEQRILFQQQLVKYSNESEKGIIINQNFTDMFFVEDAIKTINGKQYALTTVGNSVEYIEIPMEAKNYGVIFDENGLPYLTIYKTTGDSNSSSETVDKVKLQTTVKKGEIQIYNPSSKQFVTDYNGVNGSGLIDSVQFDISTDKNGPSSVDINLSNKGIVELFNDINDGKVDMSNIQERIDTLRTNLDTFATSLQTNLKNSLGSAYYKDVMKSFNDEKAYYDTLLNNLNKAAIKVQNNTSGWATDSFKDAFTQEIAKELKDITDITKPKVVSITAEGIQSTVMTSKLAAIENEYTGKTAVINGKTVSLDDLTKLTNEQIKELMKTNPEAASAALVTKMFATMKVNADGTFNIESSYILQEDGIEMLYEMVKSGKMSSDVKEMLNIMTQKVGERNDVPIAILDQRIKILYDNIKVNRNEMYSAKNDVSNKIKNGVVPDYQFGVGGKKSSEILLDINDKKNQDITKNLLKDGKLNTTLIEQKLATAQTETEKQQLKEFLEFATNLNKQNISSEEYQKSLLGNPVLFSQGVGAMYGKDYSNNENFTAPFLYATLDYSSKNKGSLILGGKSTARQVMPNAYSGNTYQGNSGQYLSGKLGVGQEEYNITPNLPPKTPQKNSVITKSEPVTFSTTIEKYKPAEEMNNAELATYNPVQFQNFGKTTTYTGSFTGTMGIPGFTNSNVEYTSPVIQGGNSGKATQTYRIYLETRTIQDYKKGKVQNSAK